MTDFFSVKCHYALCQILQTICIFKISKFLKLQFLMGPQAHQCSLKREFIVLYSGLIFKFLAVHYYNSPWKYLQLELEIKYGKVIHTIMYNIHYYKEHMLLSIDRINGTCMFNTYLVSLTFSSVDIQYMIKFFLICPHLILKL